MSQHEFIIGIGNVTGEKVSFYCVNTSYPMDNMLIRSAQTGPPNVRKRRPVFPPAGRSVVLCTPQMAPRTSFLSRQPDVIASFSFGACTVRTCFQQSPDILRKSVHYDRFSTLYMDMFSVEVLPTDQARIYI